MKEEFRLIGRYLRDISRQYETPRWRPSSPPFSSQLRTVFSAPSGLNRNPRYGQACFPDGCKARTPQHCAVTMQSNGAGRPPPGGVVLVENVPGNNSQHIPACSIISRGAKRLVDVVVYFDAGAPRETPGGLASVTLVQQILRSLRRHGNDIQLTQENRTHTLSR